MKKVTISISYDEEKLSALKLYLDQKQMQVEDGHGHHRQKDASR